MTKNSILLINSNNGTLDCERLLRCFCFLQKTRKCFKDFLEFETMLTLGLPLFPRDPKPLVKGDLGTPKGKY